MDRFGLMDGRVLGITTDIASSNYTMVKELQRSLKAMEVDWSAAQNHVPCMAHVIQLALAAFMKSLGIQRRNRSWEDGVRDTLTEEQGAKSKMGSCRIAKIGSLKTGFSKIIEKVSSGRVKAVLNSLTRLSSKDFWLSW